MKNNFDLKKFLVENKLTSNSRLLEDFDVLSGGDLDQYDADFDDADDDQGDGVDDGDDSQDPDKFDDQRTIPAWKAIKAAMQGEKGRLLSFISITTDDRQESINWGSVKEGGHSIGVAVSMDDDFKYITVDVLYDSQDQKAELDNTFKTMAKYKYYEGKSSTQYKIPASETSKVIQPLKAAAALATASKEIKVGLKVGGSPDVGSNTGPMEPGPASTKAGGSVKVGGKPFTGR